MLVEDRAPGGRQGPPLGERVNGAVEFREGRVQQRLQLGAGQAGRLLQGVPAGGELRQIGFGRHGAF